MNVDVPLRPHFSGCDPAAYAPHLRPPAEGTSTDCGGGDPPAASDETPAQLRPRACTLNAPHLRLQQAQAETIPELARAAAAGELKTLEQLDDAAVVEVLVRRRAAVLEASRARRGGRS